MDPWRFRFDSSLRCCWTPQAESLSFCGPLCLPLYSEGKTYARTHSAPIYRAPALCQAPSSRCFRYTIKTQRPRSSLRSHSGTGLIRQAQDRPQSAWFHPPACSHRSPKAHRQHTCDSPASLHFSLWQQTEFPLLECSPMMLPSPGSPSSLFQSRHIF